jgi:hypothetical protein
MRRRSFLPLALVIAFAAARVDAVPIDYTIVMNSVSGFFGAAAFSNEQVTLTMKADTSTVLPYGPPTFPFGYQNTVTPGGALGITVQLGSGSTATITSPMSVAGPNQSANNTLTFYLGTSISAPTGFFYVWDSSYPGAQAVLTTDRSSSNAGLQVASSFATNPLALSGGGTFYVNSTPTGQAGSFNSTVAVPEPAVSMMALAGLACGWGSLRRRRKQA